MKKTTRFILFFLLLTIHHFTFSQCQNFEWADHPDSENEEIGYDLMTDDSGYVYMTGIFGNGSGNGIISFDNHTLARNGITSTMFLTKYDNNGNAIWAKKPDVGTAIGTGEIHIAPTASGNIIVAGTFRNSVSFDGISLNNGGDDDIYLVEYDTNGNALWALKASDGNVGAGGSIKVYDVATDTAGNIYVAGNFTRSSTTNGPYLFFDTIQLYGGLSESMFLVKYDSQGNVLWAKGGSGKINGNNLVLDNMGNAYLTGWYDVIPNFATISIGDSSFSISGISYAVSEMFTAKFNAAGITQWIYHYGTSTSNNRNYAGVGITIDEDDNLLMLAHVSTNPLTAEVRKLSSITGGLLSTFTGYNMALNRPQVIGSKASDHFLLGGRGYLDKYDLSGNGLWSLPITGTGVMTARSVVEDHESNIYTCGSFTTGGLIIGSSTLPHNSNIASSYHDIYLAKITVPVLPPIADDISYCFGDTGIVLVAEGEHIKWYDDVQLTQLLHEGDTLIPGQSAVGTYVYYLTDSINGCTSTPQSATLTIHPLPIAQITVVGNLLISSPGDMYQWLLDGDSIVGANGQQHTAVATGSYSVVVSDTNGCSAVSDTVYVVVTGIDESESFGRVNIYPNPTTNEFSLSLESDFLGEVVVKIWDVQGRLMETKVFEKDEKEVVIAMNIIELKHGIYWGEVNLGEFVTTFKLVKL